MRLNRFDRLALFVGTLSAAIFAASAPLLAHAAPLSLKLPACTTTGNCSLDDIVATGASFANFLTTLSAALFFAAFIYGGARYLLSFGDAKSVSVGKEAMIGAAKGMAIVLFAWTIVNYLANAIKGVK